MKIDLRDRVPGTRTEPVGRTGYPDDQLYMLKLCLELQLEALLLALGSSAVASRPPLAGHRAFLGSPDLPWTRWLTEDLELASELTRDCVNDGVPLPSSMGLPSGAGQQAGSESLAARYSAMAAVVGEMLERTDPARHPMAVARLVQTRSRCEARLDELLGTPPSGHAGTPPSGHAGTPPSGHAGAVRESEAGHFLG
jgi:hypothetical protein